MKDKSIIYIKIYGNIKNIEIINLENENEKETKKDRAL